MSELGKLYIGGNTTLKRLDAQANNSMPQISKTPVLKKFISLRLSPRSVA